MRSFVLIVTFLSAIVAQAWPSAESVKSLYGSTYARLDPTVTWPSCQYMVAWITKKNLLAEEEASLLRRGLEGSSQLSRSDRKRLKILSLSWSSHYEAQKKGVERLHVWDFRKIPEDQRAHLIGGIQSWMQSIQFPGHAWVSEATEQAPGWTWSWDSEEELLELRYRISQVDHCLSESEFEWKILDSANKTQWNFFAEKFIEVTQPRFECRWSATALNCRF